MPPLAPHLIGLVGEIVPAVRTCSFWIEWFESQLDPLEREEMINARIHQGANVHIAIGVCDGLCRDDNAVERVSGHMH